jgi:hypothetical protein
VAAGDELANAESALSRYSRQAKLVLLVARDVTGSQLKARQYQQAAYAGTDLGAHIGPIAERVRQRLDEARRAS